MTAEPTPRTDKAEWENSLQCSTLVVTSEFARQLERELSLAQARLAEVEKALRAIIDAPGGGPGRRIASMALEAIKGPR